MKYILLSFLALISMSLFAHNAQIKGIIKDNEGNPVPFANVFLAKKNIGNASDTEGGYVIDNVPIGDYTLVVTAVGFLKKEQKISIKSTDKILTVNILLFPSDDRLEEVVITGTMKEVSRSQSAVPIDIITPKLFLKNPTPNLFESIGMVNGVQPTISCNVCNTGDIHINGMEGGYTMVMIDGMPIVSALSTVYGLMGIPNSMVERIEIIKGPSSTLYGSEAVGGLINVITKQADKSPRLSVDINGTSYAEMGLDAATKFKIGRATSLLSTNVFNFQKRWDINNDNFTDATLQKRVSVFNKWQFKRDVDKQTNFALRYVYEDRFGGEMNWQNKHRGGSDVYGEQITTNRFELIGVYDVPVKEKVKFQYSYNFHDQNSVYGNRPFLATQQIGFAQMTWNKPLSKIHDMLLGTALRYTNYDDNSALTRSDDTLNPINQPSKTWLPGIFLQDEMRFSDKHTLLAGVRYDFNSKHGSIFSPRLNWKWAVNPTNTFRLGLGNGYRVVNLFSEDERAFNGARRIVIGSNLKPEQSYNVNLNYNTTVTHRRGYIAIDAALFYTYFTNRIMADYFKNDKEIWFENLNGFAVARGMSFNTDFNFDNPFKATLGATLLDVYQVETNDFNVSEKTKPVQVPSVSAVFSLSYTFKSHIVIDVTGNVYSPMLLPVQENDFRPDHSPWFCLANMQVTKTFKNGVQLYGGIKNLLNFIPKNPIMRPFDPFNKTADLDNPNGYSFDPTYNYAPLQQMRGFVGLRFVVK